MGASDWIYYVPYQADISKALQELREKTFQTGDYFQPAEWYNELRSRKIIDEQIFQNYLKEIKSQPIPKTIDELIRLRDVEGTHSIIDIEKISSVATLGAIDSLSPQEYSKIFGTEMPSHILVEQKIDELLRLRETWSGLYVLIFENGIPVEICFAGSSGD